MELTRREFLKDTAVLSAAAGLDVRSGSKVLHALTESLTLGPLEQAERVVTALCAGAGCHQRCGLKVHVKDGAVVKLEAADFPDPSVTHACVKGLITGRWLHHPDRLKYPLRRVGERGSGEWERISWDEALDTIASKIQEARAEYGSQAVFISGGYSSTAGRLGSMVATRLSNLLEAVTWGSWFASGDSARIVAPGLMMGTVYWSADDQRDAANYKLYVLWGGNYAETTPRVMKWLLEARETGTQLVYIGPVFNKTAARAEWFIPVNHNTDNLLALSMINVIVAENLYAAEHVKKYTCGPLLVRSDNRMFLRESDITPEGSAENYVVWDTVANAPVAMPPGTYEVQGVDPALLGSYSPKGIACKPAFQLLADLAAQYPPNKASAITGTPAETIRDFALAVATSAAYIDVGVGPGRAYHGTLNSRSPLVLAAITGSLGLRRAAGVSAKLASFTQPTEARVTPIFYGDLVQGIKDGTYPVKVYINTASNNLWNTPNARLTWLEGVFPKLELFVVYDVFMTWTAKYADIVLPSATTTFESWSLDTPPDHLLLTQPAIAPMYECKPEYEFWDELGKRLGFGEYFDKTAEEWIEELLASGDPSVEGITLERLKREGIARVNAPPTPIISEKPFATASGRFEFYSEALIPIGEELPVYKKSPEEEQFGSKYPLNLITTRIMYFMQSMFTNVDFMREIVPEPYLEINPQDAETRGVSNGDVVRVFNDRGEFKIKARISQAVGPGTLNMPYHFWPEDFIQGHPSFTIGPMEEAINPIQRVYPAELNQGSATGCLWDCLVEVERT